MRRQKSGFSPQNRACARGRKVVSWTGKKAGEKMLGKGFVFADEAVGGTLWDAKYASSDNFMGRPAAGYKVNRVVCTLEAAEGLKKAASLAREKGLRLKLYDAYRPQKAVDDFCRWAADEGDTARRGIHYPRVPKSRLISDGYIASRSGHSRGSAVDLTLCREDGTELDMGGIFDFMDPLSHHGAPVSEKARKNRETLRSIMLSCGFEDYKNEWWHYRLSEEPYPDSYFDFDIE